MTKSQSKSSRRRLKHLKTSSNHVMSRQWIKFSSIDAIIVETADSSKHQQQSHSRYKASSSSSNSISANPGGGMFSYSRGRMEWFSTVFAHEFAQTRRWLPDCVDNCRSIWHAQRCSRTSTLHLTHISRAHLTTAKYQRTKLNVCVCSFFSS